MNHIFILFTRQNMGMYIFYSGHLSWKFIEENKNIIEDKANAKIPLKPITRQMIKILVPYKILRGNNFFMAKLERICELESISKTSVLDMFDDDPLFAEFCDLKGLARNRQFEQMWNNRQKTI